MARVPGAAKPRRTESAAQLCCGTRTAGSAAPAAEPGLPPCGAPAPRPRGAGGSGRGAAREHLGWAPPAGPALPELRAPRAPRAPRLQVRRPRRAGRVTAPPAWPLSGLPAGTEKEEALCLGPTGEDRGARQGETSAPGLPLLPPRLRSLAALVRGENLGPRCALGGWTGPVGEDRLRWGWGFSVLSRVNFQTAKCWALVSAPWISLPRVGV